MSTRITPWSAAARQRATARRYWLPVVLAAVSLLVQGCAQTPPQSFAGAADANVRVPPAAYRSVLDGYASQRPVNPAPWVERNRQVAPDSGKGGQR